MHKSPLFSVFTLTFVFLQSSPLLAGDNEEIAALKAELQQLTGRLAALEARSGSGSANPAPAEPAPANAAPVKAAADWPEKIRVKGDLRYRHESIDEQSKPERIRQRVRARVGIVAQISEDAEVGVQIASGSDDPLSTNQTLGDGASTKPLGLDLAYFAIKPGAGNKIIGGKMKNPWYMPGKSSLLWDGDLNPEGLAWQYSANGLFANVSGQWIEERNAGADSLLLGGQAGITKTLANGSKITAGAGFFDYGATKGRMPFFDGDARGNTLDASGNYANDFRILELFAELGTQLGEMPFSVYADWVKNGAAGSEDSGVLYGMRLGKASAPASWELGYNYRDIEADAVLALFTDSDAGGGGTRVSGHIIDFGYAFNKRIKAKLTYFINKNGVGTISERDYNRLQADLSLAY